MSNELDLDMIINKAVKGQEFISYMEKIIDFVWNPGDKYLESEKINNIALELIRQEDSISEEEKLSLYDRLMCIVFDGSSGDDSKLMRCCNRILGFLTMKEARGFSKEHDLGVNAFLGLDIGLLRCYGQVEISNGIVLPAKTPEEIRKYKST